MRKFDYSFLNNGMLPANLVNLTSSITELKTMAGVRKEEYTQIFTEQEAVAKVQSIKSSNAIEGIVTSDERIAAIVNQNSAPLNHNEAEIAGYRDALNEIHLGYEYIDFRQSDILRLHEMMCGVSSSAAIARSMKRKSSALKPPQSPRLLPNRTRQFFGEILSASRQIPNRPSSESMSALPPA